MHLKRVLLVALSATLSLTVAGVAVPATAHSSAAVPKIAFRDAPQADRSNSARLAPIVADKLQHAKRYRFVSIDADAIATAMRSATVDIDLFDGVSLRATTTKPFGSTVAGASAWSARIADDEGGGDVAATTDATGLRLNVRTSRGVFDLQPAGDGRYLLVEDGRIFPKEAPARTTPGSATALDNLPVADASRNSIVRVLSVYDSTARTYFGSDAAAVAEIGATINEANIAYANSGVKMTLVPTAIEAVSYSSSGDSSTELGRLTSTSDGFIDAVHTRRDQTAADLVIMVTTYNDACGVAWLYNGSAANGFATVNASCARGNLSFAHELGHNMGGGHGYSDGGGSYSYANGYRDPVHAFRTIMAYDSNGCCPRVRQFSSPSVTYLGSATGSATQDNARALNLTKDSIALFRTSGTGSSSLMFKRTTGWSAYGSKAAAGVYTSVGGFALPSLYNTAVVSRDTALFYNSTTGAARTGSFINGLFVPIATYTFSPGWSQIAAGCNTVALWNSTNKNLVLGSLAGGLFIQRQTTTLNGYSELEASCDTLIAYNPTTGAGRSWPIGGGRINTSRQTAYSFSPGWSHITATSDSVIFYKATTGVGAWGILAGGIFRQTGSSSTFATGYTQIGGTADTLVFYKSGTTTVGLSKLAEGNYAFVGSRTGFSNNWDLLVGGR